MKSNIPVALAVLLPAIATGCAANRTGPPDPGTFMVGTPGLTPTVFAPGHVSLPGHIEMGCTFSADLSEFWFVRSDGPQTSDPWTLMRCRIDGDEWSDPVAAPFDPDCLEIAPHITPDGGTFLIFRQKVGEAGFQEGTWAAERTAGGWGEPVFFHEAYCITAALDGWFYFCTDHREETSRDLARFRIESGEPTAAEDLPGSVNTVQWEAHPWVSAEGDLILFDLSLPEGRSGSGIHVTFRNDDGSWGVPQNLGEEINAGHPQTPSLSPDGRYLFYSSDGDLMWVDAAVIDALRPGG